MPEFALQLRSGTGANLPARAWYLPSARCEDWLREIAEWNVPHAALKLIPIPASASDRSIVGVLIISASEGVHASPRCIPYARLANRLYAPRESQVKPALDERELDALLESEYTFVWHPGTGLIAAEAKDVLSPQDLLAPPRRGQRRWDRAAPGIAIGERLTMIAPHVELSFEQLMEQAQDDIGTEQDALDELPPSPTEPGDNFLDRAGRAIGAAAASALLGFAKLFPGGAMKATWIDKLKKAAAGRMAKVKAAQEHLRHKEIARLLNMLEADPDKGLKFALPFGGAAHRGLAPPSNRLGERRVDFNLGGLGGGRPVDYWNISAEYQRQLITKYRELANREMRLGRYRRAAYIFAELLGDLDGAAMALTSGRHYREAAIIYRDRLKRPLDAAKCLENGGLWSEAIEQYEELKLYENVGSLYLRIGNTEKAHEAYREAARRYRADSDFLSAAKIWDEKLTEPQRAIAVLKAGWPTSPQALQCVRSLFALYARTEDHTAAERYVGELTQQCPRTREHIRTVNVLSELVAGGYPDAGVRERAGTAMQTLVSDRLRAALRSEAGQLVAALSKLAPQDRLLERDGRRFVSNLPYTRTAPSPSRDRLRAVSTTNLNLPGVWRAAAAIGDEIVAAGILENRVVLRRCDFHGNVSGFVSPWSETVTRTDARLLLCAAPGGNNRLGVYVMDEASLPPKTAFAASDLFTDPITVGALPGVERPYGLARHLHRHAYSVVARETGIVQITDDEGNLINTCHLPEHESVDGEDVTFPLPMHARRDDLYIGLGRVLLIMTQQMHQRKSIEFPRPICQLTGSAEHTRPRVALGMDEGAYLVWDPAGEHSSVPFASDMAAPHVCINRGGYVIAAAESRVEVYESKEGKVTLRATYTGRLSTPVSVLPGVRADQFAVLTSEGNLLVFEV